MIDIMDVRRPTGGPHIASQQIVIPYNAMVMMSVLYQERSSKTRSSRTTDNFDYSFIVAV